MKETVLLGALNWYNVEFYYFSKYLKALASNSPQRLLVYGKSKDKMATISTVEVFREDDQHVVNLRFPYIDCRNAASLNGLPTFTMEKCLI